MDRPEPPGDHPPEAVFLVPDAGTARGAGPRLFDWLEDSLPTLNWRSHLYILSHAYSRGTSVALECVRIAARFLEEHGFATLHLHPVLAVPAANDESRGDWKRLIAPVQPFQREAFDVQGEARLVLAPILVPAPGVPWTQVEEAAAFFRARTATVPGVYLTGDRAGRCTGESDDGSFRFYLDQRLDSGGDPSGRTAGLIDRLRANHVFESVLDRSAGGNGDPLAPCRRHLVVDERRGRIFPCLWQWQEARSTSSPESRTEPAFAWPGAPPPEPCPECIGRALLSMKPDLIVNGREREGQEVDFTLGLALARRGEHRLAAKLAQHACLLARDDRDRAAALIHQGLCRLELGELEPAEEAFEHASRLPGDRGYVAYQRGRVQFAWRDHIEALERFAEALQIGTDQVSPEEIRFQMALCHINLEEYAEARPYLDGGPGPGRREATILFYRGVCDLGQGRVEPALSRFRQALDAGPAGEDLGRILFYIGTCLKELERFDEAIETLRRAVDADPDDPVHHNLLGYCLYRMKRHEEAVACFRRAVALAPTSAIDWASLGSNLRDLGRIKEAAAMYWKALSLDPTLGFARDNLLKINKMLKNGQD